MEKRILFVEDDARFRDAFTRAMRLALAPEQLDVGFVESGSLAEARARLREGGLDAALIDVTLPDGNGWTSCERSTTGQPSTSRRSC
jgi:DNA-binding response OmpR family regulator